MTRSPAFCQFCSIALESDDEPRDVSGADISPDDAVAIHQHVAKNRSLVALIVGHDESVTRDVLAAVFGKIQPLPLLQLVVDLLP